MSEFSDFGWEGEIVSQFIQTVGRATRRSLFNRNSLLPEDRPSAYQKGDSIYEKRTSIQIDIK